ncbi:type II toxin-antitoxin system MqsR family toxin [Stenotrophomonas rhizophila]|uniref:type II toxin-antitoxin system MqsR family toxin n=1 Tax=Stenotrophomonas rhizophila TaxID=216778 RepID=UPI003AF786E4
MRTSHPHTRAGATPCGVTLRSDGVWEKQAPEYPLIQVKQVVRRLGTQVFGFKAVAGMAAMQLAPQQAIKAILGLAPDHFFKSMTAENDAAHTLWQDVYHGPTENGLAYIKFMLWFPPAASSNAIARTPKLVVSFKKL